MHVSFYGGSEMIKQIMVCDMCGEEIPTYEKEILPGIKRKFYKTGQSKYMPYLEDVLHIHLCEKCAAQVDVDVLEWKLSIMVMVWEV